MSAIDLHEVRRQVSERVAGWDTPYPHSHEWAYFPGPKRVAEAFKRAFREA